MTEHTFEDRVEAVRGAAAPEPHDAGRKDHFLKLMFFQASQEPAEAHEYRPVRATGSYAPLRQVRSRPGEHYHLPPANTAAPVRLDSPATEVMTDLRRIGAVTVAPRASIDEANRSMIEHGVRSLFVLEDAQQVSGILTSTDIQGERPMQVAQAGGIRRGELTVRDIMTPADRFEVLDLRDVQQARVGDVVATLRVAERQHALMPSPASTTSAC